jgi:hypothetical protein
LVYSNNMIRSRVLGVNALESVEGQAR